MPLSASADPPSAPAHAPNFPPDLRLLLALVRTGLGTASTPQSPADIAWPAFVQRVERHRVAPFLHRHAAAAVAATCPTPVVQHLRHLAAQTTQRALAQAAEQLRLTHALAAGGIESLTVKGLVLAQQLHGGPGGRHAGDIDLVVRPADVASADAILQAGGLRRSRPDFALTPRQFQEYLRLKPEFEYVRDRLPLRVELLWRLEGLPDVDRLWSRALAVEAAGHPQRTLPPDLNALYLFQHGARHGWFRLFWLIDVARLMQLGAVDWAAVVAQARVSGGLSSLLQGALLCRDLLGVAPPAVILPSPSELPALRGLVAEATRQLARTSDRESTAEWFRQAAYRVRLQEGARARLRAAAPHLSSPLNWQTWPLPDRWFWLYRFASPILWACRRTRRSFARR